MEGPERAAAGVAASSGMADKAVYVGWASRAADEDPAFAGQLPRVVAEMQQIFDRTEIETYLDTVHRVGALGHVSSDEVYEGIREAGAIDEDPVARAEDILLIERLNSLLLG